MSSRTWSWAIVVLGLASFAVAFVPLGSMTYLDYPMLTMGLAAAVAAVSLRPDVIRQLLSWRVSRAMGIFLVWALVCAALSGRVFSALFGNPGNGWGWLTMVAAACLVFAASGRRTAMRQVLVITAPWIVLAESAVATYEWATKIWPAGTMSNPSYLLLVLSVLLPMTALVPEGASVSSRRLRYVALLAGLWTVGISGARVGFVLVAVWMAWALWQGRVAAEFAPRTRRIALIVLAALAIPAGIWTYLTGGVGFGGFLGDRLARVGASWAATMDRPLTGWGPDGFFVGAAGHATKGMLSNPGTNFGQIGSDPHNFLAWTGVSLGITGLFLLAWVVFEVGRNWLRQIQAGVFDDTFAWAFGLFAAQVLFAPAAVQTLPLAAMALGTSLAIEKASSAVADAGKGHKGRRGSDRAARPVTSPVVRWVVTAAFVACALAVSSYALTRLTVSERPQDNDPRAIERAASFWSDPYLWYQADLAWGWAIQRDASLVSSRPELTTIHKAVELEPLDPVYLLDLARAEAVYGAPRNEVEAAFDAVYRVFPLSPDCHSSHALYLLAKKDAPGAWSHLRLIKDMKSMDVFSALSSYYKAVGQTQRAAQYEGRLNAALKAQDW